MNERNVSILMIILGLIALLFPIVSTQTIGVITGMAVLLIGICLLVVGIAALSNNQIFGLLSVLFGVICFIFAYQLIFNPAFVSGIISLIIYLIGFILIVMGILSIVTGSVFEPLNLVGISTLIFGIITIVVGVFVHNPAILGTIIGIWLIVSGLLSLFGEKKEDYSNKDYIDV